MTPTPLTCTDLAAQGLWDTEKCCSECHNDPRTLCMGIDEYQWLDGQTARLCSSAYWHFWGLRHDPYDAACSTHLFDGGQP